MSLSSFFVGHLLQNLGEVGIPSKGRLSVKESYKCPLNYSKIKLFGIALTEAIEGPTQDQVPVSVRPSIGIQAKVSYVGKFTHSL